MNQYGVGGRGGGSRGGAKLLAAAAIAFVALWAVLFALYGAGSVGEGASDAGETTSDPEAAQAPPAPPEQTAVPAEPVARQGGDGDGEGRRSDKPAPGAKHEPGGYDPLGTGAKPGDLSETEEGRVTMAATNFVLKAYGYSGSNEQEYTGPLNRYIFPWSFYESPGGAVIKDYRRRVNSGGVQSSAVLERFEMKEASLEEAKGVAHFVVEDDFGKRRVTQELTLKPYEAVWRVAEAGTVEQEG